MPPSFGQGTNRMLAKWKPASARLVVLKPQMGLGTVSLSVCIDHYAGVEAGGVKAGAAMTAHAELRQAPPTKSYKSMRTNDDLSKFKEKLTTFRRIRNH